MRDHPRSRGDNLIGRLPSLEEIGSPPLTRGQLQRVRSRQQICGITPAHAGTTLMVGIVLPATQDHPRSRGDNDNHDAILKPVEGSPPLTRGQPRVKTAVITGTRITPAHAGTTSEMTGGITTTEDHPRSRGDNLLRDANKQMKTGSPPLTRGQRRARPRACFFCGITPAHAGTTGTQKRQLKIF